MWLLAIFFMSDIKNPVLKKVLMCKPNHFRVDYQINPWMKPGTADSQVALQQWQNLVQKYEENGILVEIIEQDENQPDMVFAADQGLIIPAKYTQNKHSKILLSNFKYPQRQGETKFFLKWFVLKGYEMEFVPGNISFEGGGEILPWNGKYFIGEGFRNSSQAFKYIQETFGLEFISLELISDRFYHLDTCMFILDTDTCFYYPKAFSEKSQELIQKLFKNPIKFSDEEVGGFAANSAIHGKIVFVQKNNPTFNQKLEDLGYKAVEVDISEFIKAGGGIHCLTFELERV